MNGQSIIGMNATTGRALFDLDHLRQSITDILTTPIGSRVCRRDYGSALPDLIDQPMNGAGLQRVYAATALALARHEPRLVLKKIAITAGEEQGKLVVAITGYPANQDTARRPTIGFSVPLSKPSHPLSQSTRANQSARN
jgi:uncharacterized protein